MLVVRSLVVVLVGFFALIGVGLPCCAEQYIGQPVATQSYHSVDDPSSDQSQDTSSQSTSPQAPSPTGDAATGSDDAEMARVKEIEAQAKLKQQQQALSGSAAPAVTPVSPSGTIAASSSASQIFQTVQTEITRLGQINADAINKVDAQIDGLTQQNQLLEQEIKQLQQAVQALSSNQSASTQPVARSGFSSLLFFAWILALSVLLIFSWVYLGLMIRRISQQTRAHTAGGDQDDEYNFMSTKEAIPAKLDLARAYIQMEDLEQATAVLQDIIQHADGEHRASAESLLKEIKQSKDV